MDLGFLGVLLALSAKSWEWGAPGPPWDHPLKIKSFIFLGLGDLGDLGDLGTVALSRSPGRICAPSSLQKLTGRQLRAAQTPRGQRGLLCPCWVCSRNLGKQEEEEDSSSCPLPKKIWDCHCQGLDPPLGTQQHLKGFPQVNLSEYSEVNETLDLCSTLEMGVPQLPHRP